MKKLIVRIGADGQVSIEGQGFKGEACLEASRKYIEGLGREHKSEKKPEYYEQAEVTTNY